MEAGNRCYDLAVPEEKNRRIIDHIASVNLPYTEYSRENLLREGLPNNKIFVTGNPIKEVLDYYSGAIQHSTILERLELVPYQYIVATAHRAENVDNPTRLANILAAFETIGQDLPIVFSCHPKTQQPSHALRPRFFQCQSLCNKYLYWLMSSYFTSCELPV
jgi:UDP-N-acetylglucosamine 2-epimerase (non-hydrolysing)